ncbi:MAG: 3-phosphoshikimate 1-carboxyvinyltransferase [Actinobacteria bacterium]|nr:3-phosphoshikimate 1-carboxyvinyltransferase [Actinomycetota bacterium]
MPQSRPAPAEPWAAPAATGPVEGTVRVPGSKSLTNRHLLLAALADGPSALQRPLVSRDAVLMVGALESLGVQVRRQDDDAVWTVQPPTALRGGSSIDCGLAGTVHRFVPPVAALAAGPVRFDGDDAARSRPIMPLLGALRDLGVRVDTTTRSLPFTVHGTGAVRGGRVEIDASASSQFVSALLLAGARFDTGLTLVHSGPSLPSRPHVEMTVQSLEAVGVQVREPEPHTWRVEPGRVTGSEVSIEPDLSSAAPFLALAALTGGRVTVPDWPARTTQAGAQMRDILVRMGARAQLDGDGLTVTGPADGWLVGQDLDLHDVGELTPVVAAMATACHTPTRLRGVGHLRGHETDRLAALETELTRVGGDVQQTEDGLLIRPAPLHPAVLRTYHDHRMAMAAAVLGAIIPGTRVEDVATTAKTYPGFATAWQQLVG